MTDLISSIPLVVGTSLGVALGGAAALGLLRRRSLGYPLLIGAVLPGLTAAGTVSVDVGLGLLPVHHLAVILLELAAALAVATMLAGLMLRRSVAAIDEVRAGLEQLVTDASASTTPEMSSGTGPGAAPPELAPVLAQLTETRRLIAAARTRDRAADAARRELVSLMSEDLRTPLAGIRALAEALEDGFVADVPRALSHLRDTATRMTVQVDDLLAMSLVHGGGSPPTIPGPRSPRPGTERVTRASSGDENELSAHVAALVD